MFRRHFVGMSVLVVAAATVAYAASQDSKPVSVDTELFKGKVVCVMTRVVEHGGWIENVRMQKIGNRQFIVGDYAKPPDFPDYPNTVFWIAADEVTMIMEYKNLEDAQKAYKMRSDRDRNKPQ